jgi:ABC-type Fe3+ transport system permease subunit
MKLLRQINLSAAIIVLVCFFMPWMQVELRRRERYASRPGHRPRRAGLLWLIPLLMVALIVSAIGRYKREENKAFAVASTICGLITTY